MRRFINSLFMVFIFCVLSNGAALAQSSGSPICPSGTFLTSGTFHAVDVQSNTQFQTPQNPNNALGAPLPIGTLMNQNNSGTTFNADILYDLTGDPDILVPEGTVIDVAIANFFGSNPSSDVSTTLDNVNFTVVGTSSGPWDNNILRYDQYTVPAGGTRYLEIEYNNQAFRFDGVIYNSQCVSAPPLDVDAQNDSGSVADSSLGDTLVLNVLANDTIDSVSPPTNFDLSLAVGASLPAGVSFDTTTGDVTVLQGTPTVSLTFDYELCEAGNSGNCETATVTLNVTNPNPPSICPFGTTLTTGTFHAVDVQSNTQFQTLQNPNNALGAPLPIGTLMNTGNSGTTFNADVLYDLTGDPNILVPEGTMIDVAIANFFNSNPSSDVSTTLDNVNFTVVGTSSGPWNNNILRYDQYTVPAGGTRYLEIEYNNQAFRFDGVIYNSQCTVGATPPSPNVSAAKTVTMFDPNDHAIPGNDIIYTITVTNQGDGEVDNDSLVLIDNMPGEISFFNNLPNPITFTDNGSNLTFNPAADLQFSNITSGEPADFNACNYTPIANDYDPNVTFICLNPKGVMAAMSDWSVSFRAQIQ